MRAVQITEFGGPEVLTVVDVPEPEAGAGQTLHDVSTAGVNYADTHHRRVLNGQASGNVFDGAAARRRPALAVELSVGRRGWGKLDSAPFR
ncbi:hypothetical protein [Blastococcus sp. SYSU DS0541]